MASSSVATTPAVSGKGKRALDVSVSDSPPKHSTPKKAVRSLERELEHAVEAISDNDNVSEASEARLVIDLPSNEGQDHHEVEQDQGWSLAGKTRHQNPRSAPGAVSRPLRVLSRICS